MKILTRVTVFVCVINLLQVGCSEESSKSIAPTDDVADAGNPDAASVPEDTHAEDTGGLPDVGEPQDVTADAGSDVAPDVGEDAGSDVAPDVGEDAGSDASDVEEDVGPPPNACHPAGTGPAFQVSARADLRWKRHHAVEQDLLAALELTTQQACSEVGLAGICFNLLYLVPLGGNDPITLAMYRPLPEPTVTTSLALDRVSIAACGARVDLDTLAPDTDALATVFQHLDLASKTVDMETAGVEDTVIDLYRRLLARDPTEAEVALILTLASPLDGEAVSARDFAKTACYAIATLTENVFH